MSSKEKRGAVIALHREGVKNSEIARRLRMPRSTVYDAVKFRQLEDCKDRPETGRPVSEARIRARQAMRKRISRNPQRSIRKMASDLGVSEKTVRRVVKEDLNLRPLQKVHYLNERMKLKPLQKVRKMIRFAVIVGSFSLTRKCSHSIHLITITMTAFSSGKSRRTGNVHTLAHRHFTTSVMV
ncbi:hypothetical protein ANCCAN_22496 [Ancylostoma caninum]|uniref:Transposase IS30-like HTH domain-containing protein n=1 Tax=Ancylostoma caninum TaxID=29170 RepID=A0A368FJK8_ANCCA|nr:hypothetical protein ANCCAN_22496 [Ancylostoma caninum]